MEVALTRHLFIPNRTLSNIEPCLIHLPCNVKRLYPSRRLFQFHSPVRLFQIAFPPLAHIYLIFSRPIFHCFEVTALVVGAEVWVWVIVPFDPVHGYQANIGVAHELLPEEVGTVI